MRENMKNVRYLLEKNIPIGSELVLEREGDDPLVLLTDLDGDGTNEWIGAYVVDNMHYLILLKKIGDDWKHFVLVGEKAEGIGYLLAIPMQGKRRSRLVVVWIDYNLDPYLASYDWVPKQSREKIVELYPVSKKTKDGTKWGYINNNGKVEIPFQFDNAQDFQSNGLAIVSATNQSGVINESGDFIVKPKYSSISPFIEGRSTVILDNNQSHVMDEKGKILTNKGYSYIAAFSNKHAVFADTTPSGQYLYGYLDYEGQVKIPLIYQSAIDFKENLAIVQTADDSHSLIDTEGNILQTYPYEFMGIYSEGLVPFKKTYQDKAGYVDRHGTVIIEPKFDSAQFFQDGRAVVGEPEYKYGVIDKSGNYIVEPNYNDILLLGENRIAVGKANIPNQPYMGSTYSIADGNGKLLTDFIFDSVNKFQKGLSSVTKDQKTSFIDENGMKYPYFPILNGVGSLNFVGSLVKAYTDNRVSYYTPEGQLIWKPNTRIKLNDQFTIREEKYNPDKSVLVYYPHIEGMKNKEKERDVNKIWKETSIPKKNLNEKESPSTYAGDFSIELFQKNLLVLEMNGYDYPAGAAHGMPSKVYLHTDIVTGQMFDLEDLFKKNSIYIKVISNIITSKINEQPENYFPDAFKGIQVNQPFYVTSDSLEIYFEPYEIAAYVYGFPQFSIKFSEIMENIDVNGAFWKSFH